jgi:hypothetical protein
MLRITESYQAMISGLGLTEEYQLLKESQEGFEGLWNKAADVNSELRQASSATASRRELGCIVKYFCNDIVHVQ